MTEELQEVLSRPELIADHWLYNIQLLRGLPPDARTLCEEMRPLVAHFVSIGVPMPKRLLQPDLFAAGNRSVRVALGKIKLGPSAAWQRGELTAADKEKCKRLHFLANRLRDLIMDAVPAPVEADRCW